MNNRFVLACAVSACCFAMGWVVFMVIAARIEHVGPHVSFFVRGSIAAAAVGFLMQLVYGHIVYRVLNTRRRFTWMNVVLAYLIPIALLGWKMADTYSNLLGVVPWLLLGTLVSTAFWSVMRKQNL